MHRAGWALCLAGALALPAPAVETLRYGLLADFPPYQLWPEGGEPGGADLDLLRGLAQRLDLEVQPLRYSSYPQLEADLRAGHVDIASSITRTTQFGAPLAYTAPYTTVQQALVTRAGEPSGALTPDLAGRRIAVVSGTAPEADAERLFPLASRVVVGSVRDAVDAVAEGRADTLLEALPAVLDAIERRRITGLQVARTFALPSGALHFALPRERAATAQALSAQLAADPHRADAAIARWSVQLQPSGGTFALSEAERAWLAGMPPLTVAVLGDDKPFAFAGRAGAAPVGLAVDLLAAALRRLGLPPPRWQRLDAAALSGSDADLVLGLDDAARWRDKLRFVGPLLEHPMVLIGRRDGAAYELDLLQGKRLALPPQHFARVLLEARYPGIDTVPCAALGACIDAVARGMADATLADVVSGAMRLAERPDADVQISGAVPQLRRSQVVGVALRHAELVPLLKRSIDATLAADWPELKARWLGRPAPAEVARRVALQAAPWLAGVLALLLALWAWHSRRLRAEVLRTRSARDDAERARSAGERFVTFLAHEVRNSLHSVIAGAELLRSGDRPAALVASLGESARSTLRLLNDLLDRDRLEAGRFTLHLEPVRLAALLQSVAAEMLPAALAKQLALRDAAPASDPLLSIDAMRVQQVVRNFVANAIKYSRRGEVVIDSSCARLPGEPARAAIEVRVRDQGPGFAPGDLAHAFEPFYVGRGAADGASTGLGLALCRGIARSMGGDVAIDSAPGRGTTATLRWIAPLCDDGLASGVAPPAQRRVLVVEDAEVYAMLLERALTLQGHRVAVAGSAAQACDALRRESFDLVVTDFDLGDGDARSVVTAARGLPQPAPAIAVMTAEIDPADAASLRAAGALVVLTKIADASLFARQLLQHPALVGHLETDQPASTSS